MVSNSILHARSGKKYDQVTIIIRMISAPVKPPMCSTPRKNWACTGTRFHWDKDQTAASAAAVDRWHLGLAIIGIITKVAGVQFLQGPLSNDKCLIVQIIHQYRFTDTPSFACAIRSRRATRANGHPLSFFFCYLSYPPEGYSALEFYK
ncbi:hypothetical protein QJS10_CPB15g01293 [Acorus calamus]|uniref:Uncharacterized protein n=1 Tax=Acorus calamus TaxID=4465 RepID=A0AAV9D6E2_ACOCL|nr:hypothetical protein QJS10_CPB15g01293 [Acorus calamus]